MTKKSKIAIFLAIGVLFSVASVKAATTIGSNITTMGSIGIGTTTPNNNLHIYSTSTQATMLIDSWSPMYRWSNQLADAENKNWALYATENAFVGGAVYDTWSGGDTAWLRVNRDGYNISSVNFPNGSIGIGTTTPINFFSIASSTSSLFDVTSSGKIGVGTAYPVSFAKMQINYNSAVDGGAGLVVSDGGSAHVMLGATSTSGYVGNYNNNSFSIRTNNEDRIMIYDKNEGADVRIGIGTTTPINFFSVANTASSLFDITSSGKIGVGTSDPISFAKMQINYDSASDVVAGLVVSDGGSAHVMLGATSTSGFVGNYNNNSFSIRTNNEDRIFIYDKNAGADVRVGIGTTTPESFLHVYKNTATTTVTVGGVDESGKGSCLKLRDSDGQGWTYCTTLDGTLSCSINSCE